jgi:hypothetical protein
MRQYDAVMTGLARTCRAAAVATAPMALVCVLALAAGCSGPRAQSPARRAAAPSPSAAAVPTATGAQRRALAARYVVIAKAGNRRLDTELDHLHERDRRDLAAAHRDLLQVAATERTFDRRLLSIAFPAATERFVQFLYWANQSRASLTAAAATAPSLRALRADERRLTLANKPVEQAVTIVRSQLGLPPPETS